MDVLEIINELDDFNLGDLFGLQRELGFAIERKIKKLKL